MSTKARSRLLKTPRVQLRDRDSNVSTYPTIKRTGDQNRKGTRSIFFDDRATIVFATGSSVHYPTMHPMANMLYMSSSLSSLSATNPSLAYPGGGGLVVTDNITGCAVRKGIADAFLRDIDSSYINGMQFIDAYRPFVEQGLHAIESASQGDPFYLTGSRPSVVGLGFSQPVSAKTKIMIDLPLNASTTFGYTEQGANALNVHFYPTVYYSFDESRWQPIGTGALACDGTAGVPNSYYTQAPVCFGNGAGFYGAVGTTNNSRRGWASVTARPTSICGFPYATQFHATSSQELLMSSYISHPFLLEKIVVECDMSYSVGDSYDMVITPFPDPVDEVLRPGDPTGKTQLRASMNTFFIMNQRHGAGFNFLSSRNSFIPTLSDDGGRNYQVTIPTTVTLSKGDPGVYVDTTRDLITYAQVVSIDTTAFTLAYDGDVADVSASYDLITKGRECIVDVAADNINTQKRYRSSAFSRRELTVSGTVKQSFAYPFGGYLHLGPGTAPSGAFGRYTIHKWGGGRTGLDGMYQTGREINASVAAPSNPNGYETSYAYSASAFPVRVRTAELEQDSPYLILPTDKLVFGWQSPLMGMSFQSPTRKHLQTTLYPGKSRVTLYGSMVKGAAEFHDTLSQQLTSDAIHEVIVGDDGCLDQFDTAMSALFSGSYVDDYVTGSFSLGRKIVTTNAGLNGVLTLDNALTATQVFSSSPPSMTGSSLLALKRTVNFVCENERFYDTLLPSPIEIAYTGSTGIGVTLNQVTASASDEPCALIVIGGSVGNAGGYLRRDADAWNHAQPFEPAYDGLPRYLDPFSNMHIDRDFLDTWFSEKHVKSAVIMTTRGNGVMLGGIPYELIVDGFSLGPSASINNRYIPASNHVLLKTFFGIGDFFNEDKINFSAPYHVITNAPKTHPCGPAGKWSGQTGGWELLDVQFSAGVTIRGWKYGIYNGLPQNSTAVFRRDHFGHPRDMLEQRQFSKFYVAPDSLMRSSRDKGTFGPTDSVVLARFVNKDGMTVKGNRTDSSNMSIYATSSLPYYEGTVKNREDPLDMTIINQALYAV